MPDRITVCKFRALLLEVGLAERLKETVDEAWDRAGLRVSRGTVVDATVIDASQSTKNRQHRADPEMGKTKKQCQWHHGTKLPIGVDATTKRIHSATVTVANVHDSQEMGSLLHGQESGGIRRSAYLGQHETLAATAPEGADCTCERGSSRSSSEPRTMRIEPPQTPDSSAGGTSLPDHPMSVRATPNPLPRAEEDRRTVASNVFPNQRVPVPRTLVTTIRTGDLKAGKRGRGVSIRRRRHEIVAQHGSALRDIGWKSHEFVGDWATTSRTW